MQTILQIFVFWLAISFAIAFPHPQEEATTISTSFSSLYLGGTVTSSAIFHTSSSILPSPTGSSTAGSGNPGTGFSTGGKVGCAIGAAVVVGLIIFWLRPKRKNQQTTHLPQKGLETKDGVVEKVVSQLSDANPPDNAQSNDVVRRKTS